VRHRPEGDGDGAEFFDRTPHGKKIRIALGDALETLKTLGDALFDLVFLDADKERYPEYYEAVLPLLRPNGLLFGGQRALERGGAGAADGVGKAIARSTRASRRIRGWTTSCCRCATGMVVRMHRAAIAAAVGRRSGVGGVPVGPAMLLVIDVGNTNTSYGVFDGGAPPPPRALRERARAHRGRIRRARAADAALRGVDPGPIDSAIIASVVPSLTDTMAELCGARSRGRRWSWGPASDRDADPLREPARGRRGSHRQRGRRVRVGEGG
jgi:hypothetical protein